MSSPTRPSGPSRARTRREALRDLSVGAATGALLSAATARPVAAEVPSTGGEASGGSFFFRLGQSAPVSLGAGRARFARAEQFPPITGMSLALLEVDPFSIRVLHWHGNAHELSYCLEGTGEMTILPQPRDAGAAGWATVPLAPGSLTIAPLGSAHEVRNPGPEPLRMIVAQSDPNPTTFDWKSSLPWLPGPVLAQTAGLPPGAVPTLPAGVPGEIVPLPEPPTNPRRPALPDVGAKTFSAQLETGGSGSGKVTATPDLIPALNGLSASLVHLEPGWSRTPHWHAFVHEAIFCVAGAVQVSVIGENGEGETGVLDPGDIAFVPVNYLHYATNVGDRRATAVFFYTGVENGAVDLWQMIDAFPAASLAAGTRLPTDFFASFTASGNGQFVGPSG